MKTDLKRIGMFALVGALVWLTSCKDEERLTVADTTDVISESLTDAYFEDIDDMSLIAMEDESPAGGRMASDGRFVCAEILIGDGSNAESGEVVIDFGTGCTDPKGNVRTGKVILNYSNGPAGEVGFTVVVTLEDYTINSVALEGTRTIERVASTGSIKHDITLQNGKATWPDESFATRTSSFTREILAGEVRLDGSAEGSNRRGRDYTMNINETLVYDVECALTQGIYMAVEGRKTFTSGGRQLIIDYGEGDCDKLVTVQVGNVTSSVNVGG